MWGMNKMSDGSASASDVFAVLAEIQRRSHTEIFTRMGLRHQIARAQLFILGGILAALALLLENRATEVKVVIDGGIVSYDQIVVILTIACGLIVLSSVFYILAISYYAHTMHMYAAAYFERKVIFDVLSRMLHAKDDTLRDDDVTALFSWEAIVRRMRTRTNLNDYHAEEQLGFSVPFFLLVCTLFLIGLIAHSIWLGKLEFVWTDLARNDGAVPIMLTVALTLVAGWSFGRCVWFYWTASSARAAVAKLRDQDMISKEDLDRANVALDKIIRAAGSPANGLSWVWDLIGVRDVKRGTFG